MIRSLAIAAPLVLVVPAIGFAATATPIGADYKIHGGDQLNVSVYGEPTLTQTVTVLPDSTIAYPIIGRVSLANQTPAQASDTIRTKLSKYLRQPIVSVGVVTVGQLTVMVLGNVKTPGKYTLPFNSHATDAIAEAGGMGAVNGDYPVARISDATGVRDASLQDILRHGQLASDPILNDDSVVYVPSPVTFNVEVVGAVDHPGELSLSEGDHLSAAIAKAGNSSNANADLNNIRVTRTLPTGENKVYDINLYKQLQEGDVNSDLVMRKNDVVFVPQAKKTGANVTSTIFGLLFRGFGL